MENYKGTFTFLITYFFVGIVLGGNPQKDTNYNHYTKILNVTDGLTVGLKPSDNGWTLNRRPIKILSGSIHYFRIHPDYWRDRLRKLRAAGANTVDTAIPWNLHVLQRDRPDYGRGYRVLGKQVSNTMTRFLDVVRFIEIAREEDLFVIIRVGPYVGADLDLGGMPGWFLIVKGIRPRKNEKEFMLRLKKYYDELLPLLKPFGFSGYGGHSPREKHRKEGGNIIAYQIDHEYASTNDTLDPLYIEYMIHTVRNADIHEMIFMADLPTNPGTSKLDDAIARATDASENIALRTASFDWSEDSNVQLQRLKKTQRNLQPMVSEFRTGWFDRWMQNHRFVAEKTYSANLARILDFPASVNVYMFAAGTNWGFINGANLIDTYPYMMSVVSSYDNDAPVNEAGDLTPNYFAMKKLFEHHSVTKIPWTIGEEANIVSKTYPPADVTGQLDLDGIVAQSNKWWKRNSRDNLTNMENIAKEMDKRQLFGFVLYRKADVEFKETSLLQIEGKVHDVATVIVGGKTVTLPLTEPDQLKGFGYWIATDAKLEIKSEAPGKKKLEILVENLGRVNLKVSCSVFSTQKKGIYEGPVLVDGNPLSKWEIIPLDLTDEHWVNSLAQWKSNADHHAPTMYKATFTPGNLHDTFLDMREWGRGIVFINGFNLGRYHSMGPIRTLYLPAPLLHPGQNTIIVFEIDKRSDKIKFSEKHIRTLAPFTARAMPVNGPVDKDKKKTVDKHQADQAVPSARSCFAALVFSVFTSFYWSLF